MSGPSEKDRELDAYLRGDSPLSKAYDEDARELPPARVDAQILADAHRAGAGPRTRLARSPFSGSWMVPASVTAVVVLAVSVAVLLPGGRPGHERQRDRFEDPMAPEAETTGTGKMQRHESKQAPAPGYAPPPPSVLESEDTDPGAPSREASPIAPALEQKSVSPKEAQPSTPAAAARPDTDAAADSAGKRSRAQNGIEAATEEGLAGKARSEAAADADAWLAHIDRLIDRGELDAARESLIEFRRVYPGAEVPERIREILERGGN